MQEVWRDVVGYEGLYQVSNLGRVKSFHRYKDGMIVKPAITSKGYCRVDLQKNSQKRKVSKVHRLVAQAFIPNPENKPEIDHIDGNKQNNRADNLRWCTHKENQNNPVTKKNVKPCLGKFGRSHGASKPIICVETGLLYWGTLEAQRETGACYSAILDILRGGKRKTAGGYHWRRATQKEIKEVMQNESVFEPRSQP